MTRSCRQVWIVVGGLLVAIGCQPSDPQSDTTDAPRERTENDPIAVLVSPKEFNFGAARFDDSGSHHFEVRNDGKAPLEIWPSLSASDLTISSVQGSPIPPGGTGQLVVEWTIKDYEDQVQREIFFETNDPGNPLLSVLLLGRVPPPARPVQTRIGVRSVRSNEGFERYVDVVAYLSEDLQITGFEWLDDSMGKHFELTTERLPADHQVMIDDPDVLSAIRVWIRAKPGLPAGVLREALTIQTNQETGRPVQVAVIANVIGPLSIEAGSQAEYDLEKNVVDLGQVNRLASLTSEIQLVANIDELSVEDLKLSIRDVDPAQVLSAKVLETRKNGRIWVFPVELKLTGNGQSISRLGPTPEMLGRVLIETNDPAVPSLEFNVKFAVTQ